MQDGIIGGGMLPKLNNCTSASEEWGKPEYISLMAESLTVCCLKSLPTAESEQPSFRMMIQSVMKSKSAEEL